MTGIRHLGAAAGPHLAANGATLATVHGLGNPNVHRKPLPVFYPAAGGKMGVGPYRLRRAKRVKSSWTE